MSYINNLHAIIMAQTGQNKKQWVGAAIGAASSLLGGLFSRNSQAKLQKESDERQQAYYEKNYAQQRADAKEDYAQQRKDYVDDLSKQYSRQVEALQSAGMNPVLAYGDLTAAQPLGGEVRASQGSTSVGSAAPYVDLLGNTGAFAKLGAEIDNLKANTNKTNAEAQKVETEEEYIKRQKDELLPEQVKQIQALSAKYASDTSLNEVQKSKLEEETTRVKKECELLDFNIQKAKEFKPYELQELKAKISSLNAAASQSSALAVLNTIQAYWAKSGLGVGNNLIESLYALLAGGKAGEAWKDARDTAVTLLNNVTDKAEDIYMSLTDRQKLELKNSRKKAFKSDKGLHDAMVKAVNDVGLGRVSGTSFNQRYWQLPGRKSKAIYDAYCKYAENKGYKPLSAKEFSRKPLQSIKWIQRAKFKKFEDYE